MRSVLSLIVLLLCVGVCFGDGPVEGVDIAGKHEEAVSVYQGFMRDSFAARSSYEYAGKFLTDDIKTEVAVLSLKAGIRLEEISEEQEEMQKRVEGYGGFDWDEKYGRSGLWRRIGADIRRSKQLKCKCDYYAATGLTGEDLDKLVEDIIERCSEQEIFEGAEADLMMLETMLLVSGQGNTKKAVLAQIDKLLISQDGDAKTKLRGRLLKAKLEGGTTKLFGNMYSEWQKSEIADDIEFGMGVAFCEIRNGSTEVLEKITDKDEDMAAFIGQLVLEEAGTLSDEELSGKDSVLISLAGFAAERYGAAKWREMLVRIIGIEKFRVPAVLYAAGEALVEVDAMKAGTCFLEAAKKHSAKRDSRLNLSASEISEKAARLVHRAYYDEPTLLEEAIKTIEAYCEFAEDNGDEQIRYVLAGMLMEADRRDEGLVIYGEIAAGEGKLRREAKLDIAMFHLSEAGSDRDKRLAMSDKFKELVDLERGAKIYCGLLLEREEAKYAEEVLVLVKANMPDGDLEGELLSGEALRQLGRLVESVEVYYEIREAEIVGWETMAIGAMSDMLESGYEDSWGSSKRRSEFIVKCGELSEVLAEQSDAEWKALADLVRAETAVLTGDVELCEKILKDMEAGGFGDDIGWIRCMGRLLAGKGEYGEAAKMWGKVRVAREGTGDGERSMKWWRSRYYEIECWFNDGEDDVVRAIEVLERTIENIPEQWAQRFSRLKKTAEMRISS